MNITITPELVGICFSILLSIITFAYIFGGVVKRLDGFDKRFEQVDKRFEQVDKRFEQVDKRFEQVNKRFEQVDKRFEHLEIIVMDINRRLGVVEGQFSVIGNSPLRHTAGGEKIFNDLNGNDFINNNYDKLRSFIGDETREYYIQQKSNEAIREISSESQKDIFASYAYKEGWTLKQIYHAFGLHLRDKIFKELNIRIPGE